MFDRAEKAIHRFGSAGASATRIASGEGAVHLTCLRISAGGTLGAHPAMSPQLFLVVAGEGWVSGPDGVPAPVSAGTGVSWQAGEEHASGTATGLAAIAVEGAALDIFAPDAAPDLATSPAPDAAPDLATDPATDPAT